MQQMQLLPWISLGLGVVALVSSFTRGVREGHRLTPENRPFFLAAGGVVLIAALCCLPTRGIWSTGQALVPSLLLGGSAVLLSVLATAHPPLSREESGEALAGSAAAVAAPVVALSLLLLLFPRGSFDAMRGFALGALLVGIFLAGGLRLRGTGQVELRIAATAELAALCASGLSVATLLAIYHLSPAGAREWMPHPALFGSVLAAGLAVRSMASPGSERSRFVPLGVVLLPAGLMAWLIGHRLQGSPDFTWAILIGFGVFMILGLLEVLDTDSGVNRAEAGTSTGIRMDVGLLAALLALGGTVVAFRELHGYGIALAAVAGVGVTGTLENGRERGLLRGTVVLVLLIALYRAFHEQYGYRIRLEFLYEHLGLLLGAFLPGLLAGVPGGGAKGSRSAPAGLTIVRVGMIGLAAAAAPQLIWVLVGSGSQAAFMVGLAVGSGFLLSRAVTDITAAGVPDRAFAGLLSLGMTYSALQFTVQLENRLEMLTRTQRVWVLVGAAGAVVLAVGLLSWLDRRMDCYKNSATAERPV